MAHTCWLNTVQEDMSVYAVWNTGSDVTGIQREAAFSRDELESWHRFEAEVGLVRHLTGAEIKILESCSSQDSLQRDKQLTEKQSLNVRHRVGLMGGA